MCTQATAPALSMQLEARLLEEVRSLHVDAHGRKYNCKLLIALVLQWGSAHLFKFCGTRASCARRWSFAAGSHQQAAIMLHQACLPADLGSNVIVG